MKFVSVYLALSYLTFAALVAAGVLQMLAAWRSLVGLALLDYRKRPSWRWALGPALIALGYAWFFGTRREIITPGPAGAELTVLFGAGVLLALVLSLLGAAILRPYRQPRHDVTAPATVQTRSVRLAQGQEATLYCDPRQSLPGPAICLVADPSAPPGALDGLASQLVARGWTVLIPAWDEDLQHYPDALILIPAAMTYLSHQPLVDATRLAAGGTGLGADLALRATAEDDGIGTIVALAPLWKARNVRPSLGLLDEMTYPDALRWSLRGRRRRLLESLASEEALRRIDPRPILLLYGDQDALVPLSEVRARLADVGYTAELRTIAGVGHLSLATSARAADVIAEWLP